MAEKQKRNIYTNINQKRTNNHQIGNNRKFCGIFKTDFCFL